MSAFTLGTDVNDVDFGWRRGIKPEKLMGEGARPYSPMPVLLRHGVSTVLTACKAGQILH